jgi:hypothetical protein
MGGYFMVSPHGSIILRQLSWGADEVMGMGPSVLFRSHLDSCTHPDVVTSTKASSAVTSIV